MLSQSGNKLAVFDIDYDIVNSEDQALLNLEEVFIDRVCQSVFLQALTIWGSVPI